MNEQNRRHWQRDVDRCQHCNVELLDSETEFCAAHAWQRFALARNFLPASFRCSSCGALCRISTLAVESVREEADEPNMPVEACASCLEYCLRCGAGVDMAGERIEAAQAYTFAVVAELGRQATGQPWRRLILRNGRYGVSFPLEHTRDYEIDRAAAAKILYWWRTDSSGVVAMIEADNVERSALAGIARTVGAV